MEVGVQGRGLVLRSRLRLEYAADFGVVFGVERLRMRLEFSVEKLKFEAWIQY